MLAMIRFDPLIFGIFVAIMAALAAIAGLTILEMTIIVREDQASRG